jgi:hypothetical protein
MPANHRHTTQSNKVFNFQQDRHSAVWRKSKSSRLTRNAPSIA